MNSLANRLIDRSIKPPFLFGILLVLQIVFFIGVIAARRMPAGHDGFLYFYVQYYFLNNAVMAGEIPLWIPQMTHGTVGTWMYIIQAGWFQNLLLLLAPVAAPLLKGINFITIFNLGVFVDELVLLTGSWLLARKLFPSALTAFFVAATVAGSCIWMVQPSLNFHFYYALPLILYFGHRFLETRRWRYFFLSGNLMAYQILGNALYFIAAISFVVCAYFVLYLLVRREYAAPLLKALKPNLRMVAALLGIGLTFCCVYATLNINTDAIVNVNYGRAVTGETPLKIFLTYGRNMGLKKWGELLLGVSPNVDMTLYIGPLPLILIFLAFFARQTRKNIHLLVLLILLYLFSAGTWFSVLLYHVWPFMKFYRHLGLTAPVMKLFLCFWAGCGFEALVRTAQDPGGRGFLRKRLLFLSQLGLLASVALLLLSRKQAVMEWLTSGLVENTTYVYDKVAGAWNMLSGTTMYYYAPYLAYQFIAAGLSLLLMSVVGVIFSRQTRKSAARLALILLVALHVIGLQYYKLFQLNIKTVPVRGPNLAVTRFQPMPFHVRRKVHFGNDSARTNFLKQLRINTQYWRVYAFLFRDELGHACRTDYWMRPINDYMKAYWGQPLNDDLQYVRGLRVHGFLEFPMTHPASAKIAGATADKIQFFRKAFAVCQKEETARLLRDPDYAGDFIFIEGCDASPAPVWTGSEPLSGNARAVLPYEIRRFDANHLVVTVDVPGPGPLWMLVSDVWHPDWKATVNGKPVPVGKANLAYKAVRLPPGKDTVHFFFRDRRLQGLYLFWGLTACLWLGIVLVLTARIFVTGDNSSSKGAPAP